MATTLGQMRRAALLALMPVVLLLVSCGDDDDEPTRRALIDMTVSTTAFDDGGSIPVEYTCEGTNREPELTWSGEPQGTEAIAVTVIDPDAGDYEHLVRIGDRDVVPWRGPCPPPGDGPHHYVFTVYALDTADVERDAIVEHAIASGTIAGTYERAPED
jgi:hypothetical protein